MKTQLAIRNLMHNKARTAVAISGVAFAVILVFMQLGFLGAVQRTATLIYDGIAYDIVLCSPAYVHLCDARFFPRNRVLQAASLPEVERADSFYIGLSEWQHPRDGSWHSMIIMGTDPSAPVFTDPEIRKKVAVLGQPQYLLIDRKTKRDFGPTDGDKFGDQDVGVEASLGNKRVSIQGHFELGTGLAANGAVLLSDRGFARISGYQTIDDVNLGLIKLKDPSRVEQVREQLVSMFKDYPDVQVLTRQEVVDLEERRWTEETNIGTIFELGVVVSLVVGVAIVYQVLSTDVTNMLGEYATLKAMGYRDGYLSRVILQQAFSLAILGFFPGMILSWLLYLFVAGRAGIPIEMTAPRALGVLCLSITMCALSGLGALRKIRTADPADLF